MLTRKKVIDNLESYMESTNQTQTDIAKRLQVTPQAINNWLTRRREPSEETRFSVSFSSYSRTSVRNLNRRAVPCRGPRLFRLTRSIRFFLRETAHWAVARLAPPVDVVLKDAHFKESLIRNSEQITRKRPPTSGRSFSCGLYWTRTSDPIDVNDVLYQLSQQTIGTGVIIPTHFFFVKA